MKAKPAKAVVKAAKVAETVVAMAEVVAMDGVPARMARVAIPVVRTTSKPSSASRKRTTAQSPPLLMRNCRSMPMARRHALRTANPVRSAHVTATAVNVPPVETAANAKSARTCASRHRRLPSLPKPLKHQPRRPK